MKTKKVVLIVVLCIVVLLIAIWGIREYVLWNDGIKKGEEYPNYHVSFVGSNNEKYDIYVKDNVFVEYCNNEFRLREDYNTNEYIMIFKTADKEVAGVNNNLEKLEYQQGSMDYSIVNKLDYKYLGEKDKLFIYN